MASAKMNIQTNPMEGIYQSMLNAKNFFPAGLARDVGQMYKNAQVERWKTEGASEGTRWAALNPAYKKHKAKKFAAYPGGGETMLVATSKLQSGVLVTNRAYGHTLIEGTKFNVYVTLPYAPFVDEKRDFSTFSRATIDAMKQRIRENYIRKKGVL